jgi:cation-transporting ATPase E
MPNTQRFRKGFFRRVLKFAMPAGLICALSAYATYGYTLSLVGDSPDGVEAARSGAVVTLFVVAWWVLVQIARPWNVLRLAICASMLVGFLAVLFIPALSTLFELSWHADREGWVALGVGAVGAAHVTVVRIVSGHGRVPAETGERASGDAG